MAALVAQQPARFGALAVIPMDDMDSALEETAYALDVLKLDGLGIVTHHNGRYLGDKAYDRWFEELDRRGVTVSYIPPSRPASSSARTPSMCPSWSSCSTAAA